MNIPVHVQKICFPLLFVGFGVFTALFPFHTWVPDGHSSAPTAGSMFLGRYFHETGRLWLFAGSHLPYAGRSKGICQYYYCSFYHCHFIWRLRYHDAEGSEIYQCLFIQ